MDFSKFEFEIKRHAFIRAMQRGVTPDMIEATLKGGRVVRHGKNNYKFCREYEEFTVVCVDRIQGERIIIVTIEVRK
ncbi:hypothetical protein JW756_05455 [Candidatus Woesearchaeota archaeon]|nr:hypothetical protein [Candidatus Woesearchaeota archaeon]